MTFTFFCAITHSTKTSYGISNIKRTEKNKVKV